MKKPITLVLALLAYVGVAQYNKTFDVTGNTDFLIPSFVIPSQYGGDITVSIAYDAPGLPRTDYFVVTKTKCDGSVVYNIPIYNNNPPTDGMTNVESLIETPQGDVLIAGYHYDDPKHIQQPMVIQLDINGNFNWKMVYYVNKNDIVDPEINKISMCAVAGSPNEYFVVASADSDGMSGNDVVTNVIRIDANNKGNMLMNRKYYFPKDYNNISREYPGDIEYSPVNDMYMITGYRLEIDLSKRPHHSMFFFGIDNGMNVIPPGFRTFFYPSRPVDQDMVYDINTDAFAVTFTHERNQFIPTINSVMGFMAVDAGINIVLGVTPKYYWHFAGIEHNARSISISYTGEYVIGAGIFDNGIGTHNPSIFKINTAGFPTTVLTRYNINDNVYFGHHNTTTDCSGNEGYMLVSEHKTDLRSVLADFNTDACGAYRYDIGMKDYMPADRTYSHDFKDVGYQKDFKPSPKPFDPPVRDCFPPGNSYRPAVATAIAQLDGPNTGTALYPTILSIDNAKLTVENNSDASVKMEMYNIAGQLILSNGQVGTGKSEIELNTKGNLSEGIYLVKVYDATGSLTSTTKLLITK